MRDRLLARVIDWLLTGMLALALVAPGIAFMVASGDGTGTPSGAATGVFLAGLLVAVPLVLLYEPYLIRRRGATVGKKAMKLTVRMEATGALPTAKAAWFRFGVPVVAALAPLGSVLVYVLVYGSPFFDSSGRRQGWHDRVAGTVVVKG